jgi:hypothetical protein
MTGDEMKGQGRKWFRASMAFLLLSGSRCAAAPAPSAVANDGRAQVTLHEGQSAQVAGTDLIIRVEQVRDLTSQGCLGGPVGCKDQVVLEVRRGAETQTVVLYLAHTQFQRQQGIDRAQALGCTIRLAGLREKDVTLDIRQPE